MTNDKKIYNMVDCWSLFLEIKKINIKIMNGDNNEEREKFNSKFRMQMDLRQVEEDLRRVRNEILNVQVQVRKYQQDYSRAKLALDTAEARLKNLKREESELNQSAMQQKRTCISKK